MNYKKIFFALCCCFALLLSYMQLIRSPITASATTSFQRSLPEMPVGIQAKLDEYMAKDDKIVCIYASDCTANPIYYINIILLNPAEYKVSLLENQSEKLESTYNGYRNYIRFVNNENKFTESMGGSMFIKYDFNADNWAYAIYNTIYRGDFKIYAPKTSNNGTPEEFTANLLYSSTDIVFNTSYTTVLRPANSGYNYFEAGGYTFSGNGITGGDITTEEENNTEFIGPNQFIGNGKLISRDFNYGDFYQWCLDNNKQDKLFDYINISVTVEEKYVCMEKYSLCWYKYNISSFENPNVYKGVNEIIKPTFDIISLETYKYKAPMIYEYFDKCLEEYREAKQIPTEEPNYTEIEEEAEKAENTSTETGILYWIKAIYKTVKNIPNSIANSIQNKYANFVNNVENDLSYISLNLVNHMNNFNNALKNLPKNINAAISGNLGIINKNIQNHDDFTNKDLNYIIAAISEGGGSSGTVVGGLTAADIDNVLGGYFGANPVGVFGAGGVMGAGGAMLNTIGGIADGINSLNSAFDFGDTSYNQHISNIDSGISDLKNIIADYNGSSSANGGCGFEEESYFIKLHDEIEYWVVPQDIPEQEEIKYLFTDKFGFIMEIRNITSYMYDIADGNININSEITTNDNPLNLIDNSTATETPKTLSSSGNSTPTIIKPNTEYNIKIDYLGLNFDAQLINLEYYDSVKPMVDKIIIGLVWGFYLFKLYARLPGIMAGEYFSQKSDK